MSLLDDVLNEGLDELLCSVRQLPNYSNEKRKAEEYTIINYDLDCIMFKLEEYLKNLPVPGVRLSVSNLIVIHNLRHIFEGVSIIFDMHINHLTRLFSNWTRHKYQKQQWHSAEIMKPKEKTEKTRKLAQISEPAGISIVELTDQRAHYGLESESFFEVGELDAAATNGAALFEGHYDELRLLTTTHEPGDLLRDSMHLPLEISAAPAPYDLGRSQLQLSLPVVDEQPFQLSHQLIPEPAEAEFIPSSIVRPPPNNQFIADLEKIIEDINQVQNDKISKPKQSKYIFRTQPIMTAEQYEIFLRKVKRKSDPIKFYTTQKDGSADPRFVELSEREKIEDELLDDGLDANLLQIMKRKILVYSISLQLRTRIPIGEIPEFEFPQELQESRIEAPGAEMVLEQPSHLTPLRDVPTGESIVQDSYRSQHKNIISHLSLLMNDLSLDDFSTSKRFLSESRQPQMSAERITLPSPLRHIREEMHDIQARMSHSPVHRLLSRVETIDDVCILVAKRFSEMESDVIKFSDVCSLSETKLVAAKIFTHLIGLWNVFTIDQTSPDPNDIFIRMKN